ncbi:MAG: FtsW/RodA/SpoVE family cell cycle protein [Bacteroidales bacterium]|jgi:cell division protein FtsW|nr:FtsW/RodA/SpoVE family cell cycle protein [Bacteroidales bacterium]
MSNGKIKLNIGGDKAIWVVVILFSIYSILAVYSSSSSLAYRYQQDNTEYYLLKHLGILGLGLVLMYLTHLIPFQWFGRKSHYGITLSIFLLIAVLVFGTTMFDAKRYLVLPIINLTIQPSDFAKLALLIYLAWILSKAREEISDYRYFLTLLLFPTLIITGLILPSNLSTAAIVFFTSLVIMFIGRVRMKFLLITVGSLSVAFLIYLAIPKGSDSINRTSTWDKRIESYLGKSEEGKWQITHSKIAIAEGTILGKGPGNSNQKNWLPQVFSDFIYAIIIEEYGLAGGFGLILIYLILLFRGIRIATKSNNIFGTILAFGLSFSLVFQAFINMGVTVGLLPVTGQPLPLISMGGTSIWFTSIAIGIMLSISRFVEDTEKNVEAYA